MQASDFAANVQSLHWHFFPLQAGVDTETGEWLQNELASNHILLVRRETSKFLLGSGKRLPAMAKNEADDGDAEPETKTDRSSISSVAPPVTNDFTDEVRALLAVRRVVSHPLCVRTQVRRGVVCAHTGTILTCRHPAGPAPMCAAVT